MTWRCAVYSDVGDLDDATPRNAVLNHVRLLHPDWWEQLERSGDVSEGRLVVE